MTDARARDDTAQPSLDVLEHSAEDLYEHAPCGYLSTLVDGTFVRVNDTFLSWTGYDRGELVGGKRFQDLLAPGDRIFHDTHHGPLLLMQGEVREIAVEIVRSDGTRLPALINSVLRQDGFGIPVSVRTIVFDATDRRTYERELVRAKEAAEASEARARLLAKTLQESLIPPAPPVIPGLDIGAVYRPAGRGDEVGGDFYDVFQTPGSGWAIVLGDVAGKGAAAAVVTALARYTIRAAAARMAAPREVLRTLNRALLDQQASRLCTVVYAAVSIIPAGGARITLSAGGHPLPLRLHAGHVEAVGRPGLLLGADDEPELYDTSFDVGPGDTVVLYTDGVTEGRHGSEWFGPERLVDVLGRSGGLGAQAVADGLLEEVVSFQRGHPRDDVAIVVVSAPD
jgi:sigma-B regulation protein RsbU (phosphoserine phosphatase)